MNAKLSKPQQTIRMMVYNRQIDRYVEIKPWETDLTNVTRMCPEFWSATISKWITIPDYDAEDVADEWVAQWEGK